MHRDGVSRYPCLVPDLSGKCLSFSPLSMTLALGSFLSAFFFFFFFLNHVKAFLSDPSLLSVGIHSAKLCLII